MHDEELLYYSLKRIATTIERIINNSKEIADSEYYLLSPAGMERLESTCMLILAIGESVKGIDKMTNKQLLVKFPVSYTIYTVEPCQKLSKTITFFRKFSKYQLIPDSPDIEDSDVLICRKLMTELGDEDMEASGIEETIIAP